MIRLVLMFLLAVLRGGNTWLEMQDDAKLREAGRLKEVARASLDLLTTVERANEVDRAILDGDYDPNWVRDVWKRASGDDG